MPCVVATDTTLESISTLADVNPSYAIPGLSREINIRTAILKVQSDSSSLFC